MAFFNYSFGAQSVYWYSTGYDLIGHPTNATDSVLIIREWLYNNRSELAAATIGINHYGYSYDTIGNRLWSAANLATNTYAANSLNQYTSEGRGVLDPPQTTFVYDADGNMTRDDRFLYSYDVENRLRSVTSKSMTNGALRVLNAYDHRNRRIRKTVQMLSISIAQPPALPVEIREWQTLETHTFVWDGNNIVLEKVEFADGTTRTFEYFWGMDKSGTEQDAGGVGGMLAVSVDGVFYIPCYDHNGNIILYVSETGSIAAQYTYDPYGNIIEFSGPLADVFSFGFSTKCHDREIGMIGYQERVYSPVLGRWLNRDTIGEDGGINLYVFTFNNSVARFDTDGRFVLPIMAIPDPTPPPPPEPSPSIFDQFGFAPLPKGEERWFEQNYAGWLAEARRRFSAEIEQGIDCKTTSFNGPSTRISIEPSENRSGSTSNRTPGGNEQQFGDAGQSDWSADKVLGSFSIDYVTPVKITYINKGGGKRQYNWSTEMYIYDVLGTQEHDPIRKIPVVGDVIGSITPSRGVKRAKWVLSGTGECDCNRGNTK